MPSDLSDARDTLQFIQKGYYSKEALVSTNGYPAVKDGLLNRGDSRFASNPGMYANANQCVKINPTIMEEI